MPDRPAPDAADATEGAGSGEGVGGVGGVDPAGVPATPTRPPSPGAVAIGRAMLGLGEIIEGKPPREVYEHVLESDQSGEPEGPEHLVIEI